MRLRRFPEILAGSAALGLVAGNPFGQVPAQAAGTGAVHNFGRASSLGAPAPNQINSPLTGIVRTPDGDGYWLLGRDGGVFNYGDAPFYGSAAGQGNGPVAVGMAPTPGGHGYWITEDTGNTVAFGNAPTEPFVPVFPAAPIVGIASSPVNFGYWLVGADGGVFSYGRVGFYGSMGAIPLNAPIVGIAATPDAAGYWLVASDGGVFSFGDAGFYGSMGGAHLNSPVVGIAPSTDGRGYSLVAADGGVFSFGDASFHGSLGSTPPGPSTPVVGMATSAGGTGYWIATTDKPLPPPTPVPSVVNRCDNPANPPAVRPSSILLACGDGNAVLTNLSWSSWTGTSATASGVFVLNNCVPNCAGGTFISYPATVRLAYPIETRDGEEFASISVTYADRSKPGGSTTFRGVAPTSQG